ncbi:MAG: DoxX family membrane protein [Desulfarculales bacterium]|jgi:uncharacterized membrane protein YphA (DoxX/SURF4 family)|nr:DoxX family membrane protein [Desulfarculales bacterium]
MLLDILSLLCRLFVGFIFIYASYDKIINPQDFAPFVAQYEIAPLWTVNWGSAVFAWTEFTVSILLITGWQIRPASFLASLMLVFFTGLMIYAGITGAGFDCGCFPGDAGHPAGYDAALRDAIFLIPALLVFFRPGERFSIDAMRTRKHKKDIWVLDLKDF